MSTEERDGKREERDRTVIAECFKITQQVTGQETGASITMIKYTNVKQVRRRGGGGGGAAGRGGQQAYTHHTQAYTSHACMHTPHASIHTPHADILVVV